jgi:hypothetical protein
MSDEHTPDTEPAGSLVPPSKHPPTAVGAASSPPPPPQAPLSRVRRLDWTSLGDIVERVLDTLDVVGDTIARAAGIRRTPQA